MKCKCVNGVDRYFDGDDIYYWFCEYNFPVYKNLLPAMADTTFNNVYDSICRVFADDCGIPLYVVRGEFRP